MKNPPHLLDGQDLTLKIIAELLRSRRPVALGKQAKGDMEASREVVEKIMHSGVRVYGINTGFGELCNIIIPKEHLRELQINLIRSHAAGVGDPAPEDVALLSTLFKAQTLARGYSGVRSILAERLLDIYSMRIVPHIPEVGSVGASGDLAPLAHLSLLLIGEGRAYHRGKLLKGRSISQLLKKPPLHLEPKEGLSLVNGTQFSSAYGVYVLLKAERLLRIADLTGAMALEGFACHTEPFEALVHELKPFPGQKAVASRMRELRKGSRIAAEEKSYAQDPYSFRCMPQVLGAVRDAFSRACEVITIELNAVTDNPIVSVKDKKILSGGNFHAEQVAMALDGLAVALIDAGTLFERMFAQLLSGKRSLPLFLARTPGLHSGLMVAQCTTAALSGENQVLAYPAVATNVPTSNNQEDHVSMAPYAAQKCLRVCKNLEKILHIVFFASAETLEYRDPRRSSSSVRALHRAFRKTVHPIEKDRVFADDIAKTEEFFNDLADPILGKPLF